MNLIYIDDKQMSMDIPNYVDIHKCTIVDIYKIVDIYTIVDICKCRCRNYC